MEGKFMGFPVIVNDAIPPNTFAMTMTIDRQTVVACGGVIVDPAVVEKARRATAAKIEALTNEAVGFGFYKTIFDNKPSSCACGRCGPVHLCGAFP